MWTSRELKENGRASFLANYWRCVLVAFLIATFAASGTAMGGEGLNCVVEIPFDFFTGHLYHNSPTELNTILDAFFSLYKGLSGLLHGILRDLSRLFPSYMALHILLFNPLEVGCRRFFLVNTYETATFKELSWGFQNNYGATVVTLLLRDLYLYLWFMLFLFPGFIKMYSYRMVPYILAENPQLDPNEAITLSRTIMDGNKFKAFMMDLSFFGWYFVVAISGNLAGVFYVYPYQCAANAELYKTVRDGSSLAF